MQILTVDVGTGTQDIFLYDARLDIENGFKLVIPSPTMIVHRRLEAARRQQAGVVLTGTIMGGGPSAWAAEELAKAGLPVYATEQAARSFNDELAAVEEMGIRIIADEEARRLPETIWRVELKDFDFAAIRQAFEAFGVSLDQLAAVAVAVFDHGNAPPGVSDRQFRFDYLDARIRAQNRLSAFAYRAGEVPAMMTRLQAVVDSAKDVQAPLVVMDTAPAAVLGATFDARVSRQERVLVANIGNFHTLAFRLGPSGIEGVFEHHTGLVDKRKLEGLLEGLAAGSLRHADVFEDHGHGALVYSSLPLPLDGEDFGIVVTGPRRAMLRQSRLRPYFAVPFGDMMIAGCFGLLAAVGDVMPELGEAIQESLQGGASGTPPWEID